VTHKVLFVVLILAHDDFRMITISRDYSGDMRSTTADKLEIIKLT
jgi:hypothetical protein